MYARGSQECKTLTVDAQQRTKITGIDIQIDSRYMYLKCFIHYLEYMCSYNAFGGWSPGLWRQP
jgi:hypothetical protein